MVCTTCGTKQIFKEDNLICPKCSDIKLLSKETALKVVEKQINVFEVSFKQILSEYDKPRLIVWLLGEREKIATGFFKDAPQIVLSKFLAVNVLIKRVMSCYDLPGTKKADEKEIVKLIEAFSFYIDIIGNKYFIEEDLGYYVAEKSFNLKTIQSKDLIVNFQLRFSEDSSPIFDSFKDNLILSEKATALFLEKNKKEYERIRKKKHRPVKRTPEETIQILFPEMLKFLGALTKNKLYAEAFDLNYLKKLNIPPDFILQFIQHFLQGSGLLTKTKPKDFRRILRTKFKAYDKSLVYKSLVFSVGNQKVFPFFVELDHHLFISHNFIRLMGLFYYPVYYTALFHKEIEKDSKVFESTTVPKRLEELDFKVVPNITDKKAPKLQIDQIAWKDGILYVIETKVWDLKPYFEHRKIHNYLERDLKGVVDGKKYSNIGGEERVKDVRSLLDKIQYIKENLAKHCIDAESIIEVKGLVITKSHPIIKEYKGVRFLGFSKLDFL